MPQIPQYTSQIGLTKDVPGVRVDAAGFGQQARAVGEIGGILAQVGAQMQKVKIDAESERAKILGNDLINQSDNEALNEEYTDNYESNIEKRTENIRQQVLSAVKSPLAQQEVTNWLDLNLSNSKFKQKQYGYKKLSNLQKNIIDERVFDLEQNILNENYPNLKKEFINEIGSLLSQKADLGIITRDDALRNFETIKNELPEKQVDYDSYFKPEFVLEELKKDNLGKYEGLPKHKVDDYTIKANNRIAMVKNEVALQDKINIDKREDELTRMKVNNDPTLTPTFVKDEMNAGRVMPSFASTLVKNLEDKKEYEPTKLESIIKYNELVERNTNIQRKESAWFGIGKASFEGVAKFRADVIDSNTKGYISDSQVDDFLSETSASFYRKPVFQNALSQIAAQSEVYVTPDAQARVKAEMYGNFITKVINGEEPIDAKNSVIKERLAKEFEEVQKIGVADELQEFNTTQEADNSGLPTGTIVTVGGRRYKI